jgi:hypothetical protein
MDFVVQRRPERVRMGLDHAPIVAESSRLPALRALSCGDGRLQ